MTNPQCIHIPDGSVVVSGELFDMACAAIAERDKLLADITRTLEERDRADDYADQLAEMIGVFCEVEIGEHSNENCPWENAIEAMRVAIGNKVSADEPGVCACIPLAPRPAKYCSDCGKLIPQGASRDVSKVSIAGIPFVVIEDPTMPPDQIEMRNSLGQIVRTVGIKWDAQCPACKKILKADEVYGSCLHTSDGSHRESL